MAAELAGFEVVGAVRQFGDLGVQIADDWQLRWDMGNHVRQVETSDLSDLPILRNYTAAFQYDRQPWSLRAKLLPRETRTHVTPSYRLSLLPEEARLRTQLNYHVPGGKALEFRIQRNGWEITADPIESGGLVDRDRVLMTQDEFVLPLTQAASRTAEIVFHLRRRLPRQAERVELPLPVPTADLSEVGELLVFTDPSIALTPDASVMKGLAAQPIRSTVSTPQGMSSNQVFLFRSFLPEATFAATRQVRSQSVSADVATRVVVGRESAQVAQSIRYEVLYQPLQRVMLDVPSEILDVNMPIRYWLLPGSGEGETAAGYVEGGLPLDALIQENTERPQLRSGMQVVELTLPHQRLGSFRIKVEYSAPVPSWEPTVTKQWNLPLVAPRDGQLRYHGLVVETSDDCEAELAETKDTTHWQSEVVSKTEKQWGLESFLRLAY